MISLAFKKYEAASSLCLKRQQDILDWTRSRLEDNVKKIACLKDQGTLLKEKREKLVERIQPSINMLNMIKRMIREMPKGEEVFQKKKLQLNLLKVQIDQILTLSKQI